MEIDWIKGIPPLSAGALTVIGWWAVNRFTERRDKRNKARELRTQHLVKACRTFARVGIEGDVLPLAKELEDAVADVYLFGTPKQIVLVRQFTAEFAATQSGNMIELLADLRNELRRELDLAPLTEAPQLLRLQIKKKSA